ncbi:GPCR fungal pheromone mating factor [Russula compacta]|nr:GPCR fungal pheromone mating factor [Russula compacta]
MVHWHPPNEAFTAFSFIGFLMCAIPFYWHLEAGNTGTCLSMAWVGLGCLMQCINSIIWNKNTDDRAPIYSIISARIQAGIIVAVWASSLCIVRRLYRIAAMKPLMDACAEKRRQVIIDLLIGLGIPILEMIFCSIISMNLYDIFEDLGPGMAYLVTPLSLVLHCLLLVVIGAVSFVYSSMTIHKLYRQKRQLEETLSIGSPLNRGHYFRLMAFACLDILGSIPMGILMVVRDVNSGVGPWTGWTGMHKDYSVVHHFSSAHWKNVPYIAASVEFPRWLLVALALINFAFFGFTDEARKHYRLVYTWLAAKARPGAQDV